MNPLDTLFTRFRHLLLYGVIGSCSSLLAFLVYTLLIHAGTHYITANSISIVVGIATSFTLNRQYNFKVKDATVRRFVIFLTVGPCH